MFLGKKGGRKIRTRQRCGDMVTIGGRSSKAISDSVVRSGGGMAYATKYPTGAKLSSSNK